MVSKTWLINVVLALFVVYLGLRAYGVWFEENKGIQPPEIAGSSVQNVTKPLGVFNKAKILPESEYSVLMSLNLFSPERTESLPDEAKPDAGKEAVSAAQQKNLEQFLKKITLYGMVITEDSAEALISDITVVPAVRQGRTRSRKKIEVKQTKWVKVGDTLGEFKVAEIKPDGIRLKAGATTLDLLLYDGERIKKRAPVQPREKPRVVGLPEEKPGIGDKTAKRPLPIPVAEGSRQPQTGSFPPVQVENKTTPAQSDASAPSVAADDYEALLIRTGNKAQLEIYRRQKR